MSDYKRIVLTKHDNTKKETYFVVPLTKDEFEELKLVKAEIGKTFKGVDTANIVIFGNPITGDDKVLKEYVTPSYIENVWHNVDNYFVNCPFEWQRTREEYQKMGTYRFSTQTNIRPMVWFIEIARFFEAKYIMIYKENKKLKDITYEYSKMYDLVREGYKRKY